MSAPHDKPVVVAVKTVSQQAVAHTPVVKSSIVKSAPTSVQKSLTVGTPAGPKKIIAKKAPTSAGVKTVSSSASAAVKRPIVSKPSSATGNVAKKPKVAGATLSSKPKVAPVVGAKKVVKKIAGDDCTIDEPRSEESSDEGSLEDFLIDDDKDDDGYDDEEEMRKVEEKSFKSVDDYKKEMETIRMLFSSSAKRNKYLAEHPEVFKEDLQPK